ncbi:MAG: 2-amino-4-hydroxy-6-hydroxymethyldihydropteridine diphosphokinase [Acidobacteriaceae bacterium]|nr:2-amino-4-hydroxy-6-hydroxymethyldihydropteridine diphosphokinase [Acidobacteriaceae bacterium]MBV9443129.1 2-amino-4-hydroxy-6-hydroxymethyldihydropteridine diphosphokinase [Acidobacteriaceae bacterium]
MKTVFVSLGSNLGNREDNISRALELLEEGGTSLTRRSSFYETEPQDLPGQPWFLNMVAEVSTNAFPRQFLARLQRIELTLGRNRALTQPKGPRVIDIDILLFGAGVIDAPDLNVPHPRMYQRRFVLEPLLEIAPGLRDPVSKQPFSHFLASLRGQKVKKL